MQARLDIFAITFSEQTSPYHYTVSDFYQTNPILIPERYQDVRDAQPCLIDLSRWLMVVGNHINAEEQNRDFAAMAKYQMEKNRCSDFIYKWYEHFEEAAARSDSSSALLILNLRLWYAALMVMVNAEAYGPETRYDAQLNHFEDIVNLGEKLAEATFDPSNTKTVAFDIGYTIPVFLTATRCRDPRIRRRAVRLLHEYPRQEGKWESVAAAAIASRWIAVEEDGLGAVRTAAQIPELQRIKYINTELDVEKKAASVQVITDPNAGLRELSIHWEDANIAEHANTSILAIF